MKKGVCRGFAYDTPLFSLPFRTQKSLEKAPKKSRFLGPKKPLPEPLIIKCL